MSKAMRITVLLMAVVCMFALFATNAYAYSGFYVPCGTCHAPASGATVTATLVSNDGTNATYTIATTGGTQWAVFAGYTRLFMGGGTGGTITVPSGANYTIYTVAGAPGAGHVYASTMVNPPLVPAWVDPATPDNTPPVSSSNAVASYTGNATIIINATDIAGVEGPAWGVSTIYWNLDGGLTRTTPIGTSGQAIAVISGAKIGNHTIQFWAADRAGNDENEHELLVHHHRERGCSGCHPADHAWHQRRVSVHLSGSLRC